MKLVTHNGKTIATFTLEADGVVSIGCEPEIAQWMGFASIRGVGGYVTPADGQAYLDALALYSNAYLRLDP